jgi:Ca2+/Na+ antiporter
MAEEASEGAPLGVWIGLIIIAAVSFYCQAAVTEERFVPALNVIANEFNIPDDVAGATLMAAGASSPELFSSFVALFITHSSLGLGTIVGSEIFNQLIICAGAVFASKSGRLQLDKAIVTREVFFYGLSIAVLLVALRDTGPVEGDDEDHIFISFGDACIVFVGYVLYVWVMANFDKVKEFFLSRSKGFAAARPDYGATRGDKSKRTSFENLPDMPFLKEKAFQAEPSGNFEQLVSYYRTASGLEYSGRPSDANEATDVTPRKKMDKSMRQTSLIGASIRNVLGYSDGASIRVFNYEINISKPSDQHELYEVLVNSVSPCTLNLSSLALIRGAHHPI